MKQVALREEERPAEVCARTGCSGRRPAGGRSRCCWCRGCRLRRRLSRLHGSARPELTGCTPTQPCVRQEPGRELERQLGQRQAEPNSDCHWPTRLATGGQLVRRAQPTGAGQNNVNSRARNISRNRRKQIGASFSWNEESKLEPTEGMWPSTSTYLPADDGIVLQALSCGHNLRGKRALVGPTCPSKLIGASKPTSAAHERRRLGATSGRPRRAGGPLGRIPGSPVASEEGRAVRACRLHLCGPGKGPSQANWGTPGESSAPLWSRSGRRGRSGRVFGARGKWTLEAHCSGHDRPDYCARLSAHYCLRLGAAASNKRALNYFGKGDICLAVTVVAGGVGGGGGGGGTAAVEWPKARDGRSWKVEQRFGFAGRADGRCAQGRAGERAEDRGRRRRKKKKKQSEPAGCYAQPLARLGGRGVTMIDAPCDAIYSQAAAAAAAKVCSQPPEQTAGCSSPLELASGRGAGSSGAPARVAPAAAEAEAEAKEAERPALGTSARPLVSDCSESCAPRPGGARRQVNRAANWSTAASDWPAGRSRESPANSLQANAFGAINQVQVGRLAPARAARTRNLRPSSAASPPEAASSAGGQCLRLPLQANQRQPRNGAPVACKRLQNLTPFQWHQVKPGGALNIPNLAKLGQLGARGKSSRVELCTHLLLLCLLLLLFGPPPSSKFAHLGASLPFKLPFFVGPVSCNQVGEPPPMSPLSPPPPPPPPLALRESEIALARSRLAQDGGALGQLQLEVGELVRFKQAERPRSNKSSLTEPATLADSEKSQIADAQLQNSPTSGEKQGKGEATNNSTGASEQGSASAELEQDPAYRWPFIGLVAFMFVGATGNILVCMAVWRERRLQTATNYFLLSLAVADLLVCTLVMPFGIIYEFYGKFSQQTLRSYVQWSRREGGAPVA